MQLIDHDTVSIDYVQGADARIGAFVKCAQHRICCECSCRRLQHSGLLPSQDCLEFAKLCQTRIDAIQILR